MAESAALLVDEVFPGAANSSVILEGRVTHVIRGTREAEHVASDPLEGIAAALAGAFIVEGVDEFGRRDAVDLDRRAGADHYVAGNE